MEVGKLAEANWLNLDLLIVSAVGVQSVFHKPCCAKVCLSVRVCVTVSVCYSAVIRLSWTPAETRSSRTVLKQPGWSST